MEKVYSGLVDKNGNKILSRYYTLTNITKEDKINLFKNYPKSIRYCVIFDETWIDEGHRIGERWGVPYMEHYNNGKAVSQNMNFFKTLKEAQDDCKIIPKITNKNYSNPFIVERID